jgi:hypothetical protein
VRIAWLLALAGCAGTSTPIVLGAPWPRSPTKYDEAYQKWTRRGVYHLELIQTLAISATLESPEFRAAYAHERSRLLGLSADEEAQLVAAERAAADEAWDVELLVATSKSELNDLRKLDKKSSMWHVALIADDGRQVEPVSVRPDKRHREDLERWFPDLGMFYQPYIVRFPKAGADGQPLVGPASKRLSLEVGGSLGKVLVVWSSDGA